VVDVGGGPWVDVKNLNILLLKIGEKWAILTKIAAI
jgi:hypothetical protein